MATLPQRPTTLDTAHDAAGHVTELDDASGAADVAFVYDASDRVVARNRSAVAIEPLAWKPPNGAFSPCSSNGEWRRPVPAWLLSARRTASHRAVDGAAAGVVVEQHDDGDSLTRDLLDAEGRTLGQRSYRATTSGDRDLSDTART